MPVSKNEKVGFEALFNFSFTILKQPFFFFAEPGPLFRWGGSATGLGEKMGESGAPIGVKPAKKPLTEGMHEYFFHAFVAQVIGP